MTTTAPGLPRRWGPFVLHAQLGEGATAQVFRATPVAGGPVVALKILRAGRIQDPTLRERFAREGQAYAALNHPGILRVHAAGEHDGVPYLACSLVERATTLADHLRVLDLRGRVECVRDVALAVAHAHDRGIVHRDIKPENVLVQDGRCLVADFGMAAIEGAERLTRTGAFVGTPLYMAPEQLVGDRAAVGPRSDVWSLGVLLYEALTDELPFRGAGYVELAANLHAGLTPPSAVSGDVPRPLDRICQTALQVEPAGRYPSARELALDLNAWLEGGDVRGLGTGGRRFAAAAVVAGGALAALAAWPGAPDGRVQPATAPAPRLAPAAPPADAGEVAWREAVGREGGLDRFLAVAAWLERHPEHAQARDRAGALAIVSGEHHPAMGFPMPILVAFRADGALLFAARAAAPVACRDRAGALLWSRSLGGGVDSSGSVCMVPFGAGAAFANGKDATLWVWSGRASDDARPLALSERVGRPAHVAGVAGGPRLALAPNEEAVVLLSLDTGAVERRITTSGRAEVLLFTPDGAWLAVAAVTRGGEAPKLLVVNVAEGAVRDAQPLPARPASLAWAPGEQWFVGLVDGGILRTDGLAGRPFAFPALPGRVKAMAFDAKSGLLLAATSASDDGGEDALWVVDPTTGASRRKVALPDRTESLALSADGLLVLRGAETGTWDLRANPAVALRR